MNENLARIEKQRLMLLQVLLLVVILCLGAVALLSIARPVHGPLVPGLAIGSLATCLFVIARQRRLAALHERMVEEILSSRTTMRRLNDELEREQSEHEGARLRSMLLESRLRDLTGLYRAIATVNAADGHDHTPEAVLGAALELVGADVGSLMIVHEGDTHLRIAAARGLPGSVVESTRQAIGEGVAGWVAEHGEPVLVSGRAEDDARFRNTVARDADLPVSLCAPLSLRGRVRGVLCLGCSPAAAKRRLAETDLRLVTIFAQHGALALELQRLGAGAAALELAVAG